MSKFTQEQKDEIITLKLNETKAKEIMQKFNVSRAYIYKMLKENDIECRSEVQTNIDITEINEILIQLSVSLFISSISRLLEIEELILHDTKTFAKIK